MAYNCASLDRFNIVVRLYAFQLGRKTCIDPHGWLSYVTQKYSTSYTELLKHEQKNVIRGHILLKEQYRKLSGYGKFIQTRWLCISKTLVVFTEKESYTTANMNKLSILNE